MDDVPLIREGKSAINRPLRLLAGVGGILLADLFWIETGHRNEPVLYAVIGVLLVCGMMARAIDRSQKLPRVLAEWFAWTDATTFRELSLFLGVMIIAVLLVFVGVGKLAISLQVPAFLHHWAHMSGDEILLLIFTLSFGIVIGGVYLIQKNRWGGL